MKFFLSSILVLAIVSSNLGYVFAKKPPYPPSSIIESVTWDFSSFTRAAHGSDLWPMTWANDDLLYTAWGDGGGFQGTNSDGRVSIGVAQISGSGADWHGKNVCGGKNAPVQPDFIGKCNGALIAIRNVLYMYVTEQDNWMRVKLGKSTDYGKTWKWGPNSQDFKSAPWLFSESDGAFSSPGVIQFGPNYANARDEFIYGYGHQGMKKELALFRVAIESVFDRTQYEFFTGYDENKKPLWTSDINKRNAVFSDQNGVSWGYNVCYQPYIKRYILTVQRNEDYGKSKWGVFDAPEPWGPWTTVAYYDSFIDSVWKFSFVLNQKWMQSDGTFWMVFSGIKDYDAFNVIKGKFISKE